MKHALHKRSLAGALKKRSILIVFLAFVLFTAYTLLSVNSVYAHADTVGSSAECMALLEVGTGRILYEKNARIKRPMASTTKILTAITVIENTADLDKIIKVPAAAVGVEGSSIYLEADEELSVLDLLYGLMLQSGNDCAEALAILTSKTKADFAVLMNTTAGKIGAVNSNFVTPHGLDAKDHYTTAYDLALISAYALKNPTFQKIVSTKKHTTTWKGRNYNRIIMNKNRLLNSFEGCDGVKTGYTKKAGRCYVSSATRNGMQVVCAVLNCGPMFEECAAFMNRAFNEYSLTPVILPAQRLCDVEVNNCKTPTVAAGADREISIPLKTSEIESVKIETVKNQNLNAPFKTGTEVGEIKISVKNELIFTEKLYNIEDARSRSLFDRLKDIADEWTK